ncbi:latrophilin-like protein LAT-2 [Tachypleus tridentatus]
MTGVGVHYKRLGNYLKPQNDGSKKIGQETNEVNSDILGFTVGKSGNSISLPAGLDVILRLDHLREGRASNVSCVFWNTTSVTYPEWDTSGCRLMWTTTTSTYCACSHLTNFAVLMDFSG